MDTKTINIINFSIDPEINLNTITSIINDISANNYSNSFV